VIELLVAASAFFCMLGAVFVGFKIHSQYCASKTHSQTQEMIGLISNMFVVVTALVLGLMLNSAKGTFEKNNNNVRALASQIILLDRTMRSLEPEAAAARGHLLAYILTSLKEPNIVEEDPEAAASLEAAGASLRAIHVSDDQKLTLWNEARQLYRQVLQQRWVVVDTSGGTIPTPMIVLLILWLSAAFAGFGYRAPDNAIVRVSFLMAALLISGGLYVICDMDTPSSGLFRTSNLPFQRALAHLQR
jgi:hypothetical protein